MRFQTLYEGRHIFAVILVLGAGGGVLGWTWLVLLAVALFIFCLNFFRDPERESPAGDDVVVAAADGVVADIEELEESELLKTKCRRVGIFLSVFDVHVNKAPIAGKIIYQRHHPGLYLDARNPECSQKNEALTWAIEGAKATLVIRQLTGAIARRIVPWSQVGDVVPKGFRFGMIRFGSRTEIYLPLSATVEVKIGDRVVGASSVIARLH
jgi:phosphatidylserine decarboxylase